MNIKFTVDSKEELDRLAALSPREFMVAWTTAVKQFAQKKARENIGGDFGDQIARKTIQTDDRDPDCHEIYVGGENGYIAEHIHTGGVVRPRTSKYLAIPIDKSVKGLYARERSWATPDGKPLFIRRKEDGSRGRAYLGEPRGKRGKIKILYVLKDKVYQKPRPWWPDEWEVQSETVRFFNDNF